MLKRLISLVLILCLALPMTACAAGNIGYEWKVKSKTSSTDYRGNSWQLFYTGTPAARAGETDTASVSVSYSAAVGGTFKVPQNAILESLDVTLGVSKEFSASKTSASLEQGEYIQAYYKKTWQKWTINQEYHCYDTTVLGYDENGEAITETTDTVIDTATAYVYKPILPTLKLEYYQSGISETRSADGEPKPYKVEIYEWNGEAYVLSH